MCRACEPPDNHDNVADEAVVIPELLTLAQQVHEREQRLAQQQPLTPVQSAFKDELTSVRQAMERDAWNRHAAIMTDAVRQTLNPLGGHMEQHMLRNVTREPERRERTVTIRREKLLARLRERRALRSLTAEQREELRQKVVGIIVDESLTAEDVNDEVRSLLRDLELDSQGRYRLSTRELDELIDLYDQADDEVLEFPVKHLRDLLNA